MFLACSALIAGCSGVRPEVKVIAMSQAQRANAPEVLVYMEVVNPTKRDLDLSRLEYHLSAVSWFDSRGTVGLTRRVPAQSSTVVEISVPVSELEGRRSSIGVPYQLEGRLFARTDNVERSWKVDAAGELQTRAASFHIPRLGERVVER